MSKVVRNFLYAHKRLFVAVVALSSSQYKGATLISKHFSCHKFFSKFASISETGSWFFVSLTRAFRSGKEILAQTIAHISCQQFVIPNTQYLDTMTAVQAYPGQTIAPNVYLDEKASIFVSAQGVAEEAHGGLLDDSDNYLVVSPYTEQDHLLDLRTLDRENALLAKALVHFKSLRPDYATAPYTETFNWNEIINELTTLVRKEGHIWKETSFYIVAFRSRIPPTTVYAELGVLDKAAHAEATASGGFLKSVEPSLLKSVRAPTDMCLGTGLEPLTRTAETWQLAFGGPSRMPDREELDQHIVKLQVQRAICMQNGKSIGTALSSATT